MAAPRWSLAEAEAAVASFDLTRTIGHPVGVPVVVLDPVPGDDPLRWRYVADALRPLPVVSVAVAGEDADVLGEIDTLVEAVHRRPHSAITAALLLRNLPDDPLRAFHLESLAYATLQAGPEHAAWLETQGRRVRRDEADRVRLDDGDPRIVTLTRPRLHNLLDRRGRDELADAFRVLALDPDETPIRWVGEGPSFCAGGDPAEFGLVADAPTGHLVRAASSPAAALLPIRTRVHAHVHGACVGAGIELAALAATVSADADTRFRLPELSMGLIPGVGGTWSISRRIGRQRLLHWLLLDLEVDAETAAAWGLVDTVGALP